MYNTHSQITRKRLEFLHTYRVHNGDAVLHHRHVASLLLPGVHGVEGALQAGVEGSK